MGRLAFLTALCFATAAATVTGADLTKIDRTIAKEPAYKNQPKYCLLVFGPEAKTRIWLVLDGHVLYVDKNGNGNLTEPGERVEKGDNFRTAGPAFHAGDIIEPDSKVRHTGLKVDAHDNYVGITVAGQREQAISGERGYPQFSRLPQDAPIIHFNRPLTFGLVLGDLPRHSGEEKVVSIGHISVEIGAPGLGEGTFAAIGHDAVPPALAPIAEVVFPNRDPKGKPIKVTTVLSAREVPDNAGQGKATITLSFQDWKEGQVVPATFEVPIEGTKPK